jgi:hypothetical protein
MVLAELSWRPENSATVILSTLLKIHSLALLLVILFGFKYTHKAIILVVEKFVFVSG